MHCREASELMLKTKCEWQGWLVMVISPPLYASKRETFLPWKFSMNINNNETSISSCSSTFHCPFAPQGVSFETCGSRLDLIFGIITVMVSIPTILLNAFIILAIKQKKDLQKTSNIMLSSLAVTDLLVGVIAMPITATIYFFTGITKQHSAGACGCTCTSDN